MKKLLLKSTKRNLLGEQSVKSLRRNGIIPGILYGPNIEPVSLSVELADIYRVMRASRSTLFLLDLELEGKTKKVAVKELQKHPVSGDLLHIDFYEVAMDRKVKVSIPVRTIGKSQGVELGGMLQIVRREVDVLCLPGDIPESVIVDITDLDIGDSVHLGDISLPESAEMLGEANFTVLTILIQKKSSGDELQLEGKDKEVEEESSEI